MFRWTSDTPRVGSCELETNQLTLGLCMPLEENKYFGSQREFGSLTYFLLTSSHRVRLWMTLLILDLGLRSGYRIAGRQRDIGLYLAGIT